jgi:hypothetical protein
MLRKRDASEIKNPSWDELQKKKVRNEKIVSDIEKHFKHFAHIDSKKNLEPFPLKEEIANIAINKEKSKEFSEVFTPLWLVDQMIGQVEFDHYNTTTLDLCAGYGQFSVRMMRYLHNTFSYGDVREFLKHNHAFSELQLSSCYKILRIFGDQITLFIGDSTHLNKLPENANGLWVYIEEYKYWVCLTETIRELLCPKGDKKHPVSEKQFVESMEALIANLNEVYTKIKDMYNLSLQQMTRTSKLRLELIKGVSNALANQQPTPIQNVYTPEGVIDDMLACVEDIEKKTILVLFNMEIVEHLINKKKVDPANILFAVDFNGSLKATAMNEMYGVDTTLVDSKLMFLHSAFKGRKFDVCLSNPPYNDNVDLRILLRLLETSIATEFVVVHPSTWLIDIKGKEQLYNTFKSITSNKIKSVKVFNGNKVFGVFLYVPCVITHIDLNHSGDINVDFYGNEYSVNKTSDITKFGQEWLSLVKPFIDTINKRLSITSNIWSKNVSNLSVDKNKHHCQLACIRGNVSKDPDQLVGDDFYTMCVNDDHTNKGIRKTNVGRPKSDRLPTFEFDSEIERDNFISYVNTDFARFCLSIFKVNAHLDRGELTMIPWLDFTQAWDDEKLFKHFDINQETQDYIRKFLPDYYGIRK